jgi:hypothetical protein
LAKLAIKNQEPRIKSQDFENQLKEPEARVKNQEIKGTIYILVPGS